MSKGCRSRVVMGIVKVMVWIKKFRSTSARLVVVLGLLALPALVSASVSAQGADPISTVALGDRIASKDINLNRGHSGDGDRVPYPRGMWADESKIYVADRGNGRAFAFNIASGDNFGRYDGDSNLSVSFDSDNTIGPLGGIWSDGDDTYWVSHANESFGNGNEDKARAFNLSSGERDSSQDVDYVSANYLPGDIWSDGTTLWVTDAGTPKRIYAYTLSSGARDSDKGFNLHSDNADVGGIWSDETTMWVVDFGDDRLYAYTLSTGERDQSKEFSLTSANAEPFGIWSDGTTVWVGDQTDDKLYAYSITGSSQGGL